MENNFIIDPLDNKNKKPSYAEIKHAAEIAELSNINEKCFNALCIFV